MKLHKLYLKNIGPFLEGEIEFDQVTILTGENGTGKTVVLDAIRKMLLSGNFKNYDIDKIRHIRRSDNFYIEMSLTCNKIKHILKAKDIKIDETSEIFNVEEPFFYDSTISSEIPNLFQFKERAKGNLWIANYWTSQNDHSDFHISSLDFIKPENYLINSLDGIQKMRKQPKSLLFLITTNHQINPRKRKKANTSLKF